MGAVEQSGRGQGSDAAAGRPGVRRETAASLRGVVHLGMSRSTWRHPTRRWAPPGCLNEDGQVDSDKADSKCRVECGHTEGSNGLGPRKKRFRTI